MAGVAFALLLLAPAAASGMNSAGEVPAAVEPPIDTSPLPPMELPPAPPPARARPAPTPEPEAEAEPLPAATATEPATEAEPTTSATRWPPPGSNDRRLPFSLILGVGAFASDAGAGLMADVGVRILPVSLRYTWRTILESDTDPYGTGTAQLSYNGLRAAWNFGLWSSSSEPFSVAARAGVGVGELRSEVEDPWTGEPRVARQQAGSLEAGLVFEYGFVSIFDVGLEVVIPGSGGGVSGAPAYLLSVSVNPLILLRAL